MYIHSSHASCYISIYSTSLPLDPKHVFDAGYLSTPALQLSFLAQQKHTAMFSTYALPIATGAFWTMFLWVLFLIFDYRRSKEKPSLVASILLVGHMWLATAFLATANIAHTSTDPGLIWFAFLVCFRHYKTAVNMFFYFRYKPAVASKDSAIRTSEVTVIVPTVGPNDKGAFAEMVSGILYNRPGRLIFCTPTEDAKKSVESFVSGIIDNLTDGISAYQLERNLDQLIHTTRIGYISAGVASKREQFVRPLVIDDPDVKVDTDFIASADDTAIWHPKLLSATLPAFQDKKVGLVGTRKWNKRHPRPAPDPSLSWFTNAWNKYCFGFWNAIGATYLIRHNFEACATNAADGGIFTVSGRTFLVRTEIIRDEDFQTEFLDERILKWLPKGGIGPINADDDTFLTRWVMKKDIDVKFQSSEEATVTVNLGKDGAKRFLKQCLRWSRTTIRQFPRILFLDRTAWWRHPLTIWTTYFPWLYNAALVWDPLMIVTLCHTRYYQESEHCFALVAALIGFIWATKCIKLAPWFWMYPQDFFLYFFPIPVWVYFVYRHSILKIYTALTFWDLSWTGRKLPIVKDGVEAKEK